MASCTPFVTPLHADGLSLRLRRRQYRSRRCEAERSRQPHKRQSLSTRDRFVIEYFCHVGLLVNQSQYKHLQSAQN
jgi:hypothetical protein